MKKHFNFKSLYRTALVALCLLTVGVGDVLAGYVYLDPSGFTDWYNDDAWFRLWEKNQEFEVTTRTNLGNGLWRFNVGDFADGEYYFQRMRNGHATTVDNQALGTTNGSQNIMKITGWNAGSMQTNFVINWYHNTNEIYFDNSVSNFLGKIYFVIGHDYHPTGSVNTYSVAYEMSPVIGTKLYHVQTTAEWNDANYYAVIASSTTISGSDNSWGSSFSLN